MRTALVLALLLSPLTALAVPEAEFEARYARDIWPFYQDARRGFFSGANGVPISFVAMERGDEKGAVVVLPGRGELHGFYAELYFDLSQAGWSVYAMDHRGQGQSGRMLDNKRKGHVEDFELYANDVKTFMDLIVRAKPHQRVVVFGHSMGGFIASRFAQRFPKDLDALVLSAPMHQPNYGKFTEEIAGVIGFTGVAAGQAGEYAVGQGDPEGPETFEDQHGTHSHVRWEAEQKVLQELGDLRLGGVTYGWGNESVKGTRSTRSDAVGMSLPILLMQCGQDVIVMAAGQDEFCSRAAQCRKVVYPDSRHGPLREEDATRVPAFKDMVEFMDAVQPQPAEGCTQAGSGALGPVMGAALLAWWASRRRGGQDRLALGQRRSQDVR